MSASVLRIPNFVKARSPKRLRVLMLEVNAKFGLQHKWLDIQWVESEKQWYAWYMELTELDPIEGGIIDGD